jgi:hypothetical protein
MGGLAFTAATVVATNGAADLNFGGTNEDYGFVVVLQDVPGPGTYTFSDTNFSNWAAVTPGVGGTPNSNCCWAFGTPGVSGSVTVTSITATRAVGTFEITLPPQSGTAATTPISITSGAFNVGFF